MDKLFKRNYFFVDKFSTKQYIFVPIVIQIAGIIVFVSLATVLLRNGVEYNKAIIATLIATSFFTILSIGLIHIEDLRDLNKEAWPLHSLDDYLIYAKSLLDGLAKIENDYVHMLKSIEQELIKNRQLYNKANSIQAVHLLPEIQQISQDMLETRRKIIDSNERVSNIYVRFKAEQERFEDDLKARRKKLRQHSNTFSFVQSDKYKLVNELLSSTRRRERLSAQIPYA